MILLVDNYDSFTYNLYQMAGCKSPDIKIIRNDEISVEDISLSGITHVIISPGPGKPSEAGICKSLIKKIAGKIPLLGVCLGHQAICEAYNCRIIHAKKLMHGKESKIHIANASPVFAGLGPVINAGRYHSLSVERETFSDELFVIAEDEYGEIMAVKHRDYNIFGLQFHPESVLTQNGELIIENFLKLEEG